MRPYTKRMSPPFTMIGSSVAEVEETRNPNFKKGQTIVVLAGWVERGIVNPDAMGKNSPGNTLGGVMPAPDLGPKLSKSLLLGALGCPATPPTSASSSSATPSPGRPWWSAAPPGQWAASWARSPRSRAAGSSGTRGMTTSAPGSSLSATTRPSTTRRSG